MRELGSHEVHHSDTTPLICEQQILTGGEPSDAIRQPRGERSGVANARRLAGDRLHHSEEILAAMIVQDGQGGDTRDDLIEAALDLRGRASAVSSAMPS